MPPTNNASPFNIIAAPFTVWYGPEGATFPAIDDEADDFEDPAGDFTLVGTFGNLDYKEDGVTVTHNQTIVPYRALGDCGVRKNFRTEEDQQVRLMLADITLEGYQHALNGNTITTVVASLGVAGHKKIGLSRGFPITTVALLVRGPSPYIANGYMQYEIPRAQQVGNPETVYVKGVPAGLALTFSSLVDENAASEDERMGVLRQMTAVALT